MRFSAPAFADGLDGMYQGSIFGEQTRYGINAEFRTTYQTLANPMTNPTLTRPFLNGNLTLTFPNSPSLNFSFADASTVT